MNGDGVVVETVGIEIGVSHPSRPILAEDGKGWGK